MLGPTSLARAAWRVATCMRHCCPGGAGVDPKDGLSGGSCTQAQLLEEGSGVLRSPVGHSPQEDEEEGGALRQQATPLGSVPGGGTLMPARGVNS